MVDIPPSLGQVPERDISTPSFLPHPHTPDTMSTGTEPVLAHKTELITKVREHRPKRRRRRALGAPLAVQPPLSDGSRPPPTSAAYHLVVPGDGGEQRRYSETVVIDRPMTPVTVEIATVTQTTGGDYTDYHDNPEQKRLRDYPDYHPKETPGRKLEARQVHETKQVTRTEDQVPDWSISVNDALRNQQRELLRAQEAESEKEREIRETILKGRAEMSAEQTTQDETVTETKAEPTIEIEEEKSVKIRSYGVIQEPLAPAQFEQPTRPQVVREGEEAIFSAVIKGRPLPSVKWLKDRKEVIPTDRVRVTYNKDTRETVLTISNVRNSDQGNYTCQATNPISRANSTSNLVLVRKYPTKSETTENITTTMDTNRGDSQDKSPLLIIYVIDMKFDT